MLHRQVQPYVNGEYSARDRELAQACPTTNIGAERRVSMGDAQIKRAPNARMDFIEAKVWFKFFCGLFFTILSID